MPQIQTYDDRLLPQGGIAAQATGADFGSQVGQAEQQLGSSLRDVADTASRVEQDQGRIWAYDAASKKYTEMRQKLTDQVNALDPTDPDFTQKAGNLTSDFQSQLQAATQELQQAAPSKSAERVVSAHMATNSRSLLTQAMSEQARISGEYTGMQVSDGVKQDQDQIAADPSNENYNRILQNRKDNTGGLTTVDPVQKMKWIDQAEHNLALTQVQVQAATTPNQFLSTVSPQGGRLTPGGRTKGVVPGGPTDFGAAVNQVLQTEGGYSADDVGTGPVNMGIGQRDLPAGMDVKNLTRDQAIGIYKSQYWDAIGADKLSPELRMTAFDSAVNAGVGWTKQALAESGGDVAQFNALREAHYRDLAASNPDKYGASLPGWLNRLSAVSGGEAGGSNLPQVAPMDDGAINTATPNIAGWGKLSWNEKVAAVRQAESVVGGQLATDRGALQRDLKDAETSLLAGKSFDGLDGPRFSRDNLVRVFGADVGGRTADQLDYTKQVGGFIGQMTQMPVAQAQQFLQANAPQGGPEFAAKEPVYKQAVEGYMRLQKLRSDDFMAWAQNNNVANAKPLDTGSAQDFQNSIHDRIAVAQAGRIDYGANADLLSKGEADQVGDMLQRMNPRDQMSYLKSMMLGTAGQPNEFQRLMTQLAPKNTMLAQAAIASNRDGTVTTASGLQDGNTVGQYILEGTRILQGKDLDDPTKSGRPLALDDKTFRDMFWNSVGSNAFASLDAQRSSQIANDTYQATKNYLAADIYHRGMDPRKVTPDMVSNAVQAVTGGTVQSNKGDSLFVPWGMPKDQFQTELPLRAQAAIEQAGWKGSALDKLDAYHYVNLDDGKYGLMNGNRMLTDKTTGRTVVVDFKQPAPASVAAARAAPSWMARFTAGNMGNEPLNTAPQAF